MKTSTLWGILGGMLMGGALSAASVTYTEATLTAKMQERIKKTGISVIDYEKIKKGIDRKGILVEQTIGWQRALDSLEARSALNKALLAMKKRAATVK